MSQKEENIDVNLYIDELKSDDPMLKLNAISKLNVIASALSKSRVEDEFFSYLTFIITELDNEDEFLLKLSENLYLFLSTTPSIQKTKAIKLFEPLACIEDTQIRQSSVKGLILIAEENLQEILQSLYRLINYSTISKISALETISGLLKNELCDSILLKESEKIVLVHLQDNSLPVRRSAIRTLTVFWQMKSKFIGKMDKSQDLKFYTKAFLLDFIKLYDPCTTESILFETLNEDLVSVLSSLLDENALTSFVDMFILLLNNKEISWRIKFMVLSNYSLFLKRNNKITHIIDILKKLFKEEEQEVRSAVVRAFGGLIELETSQKIASDIWESIKEFVKNEIIADKNIYVKESFVTMLRRMLVNKSQNEIITKTAIELFESSILEFSSETKLKSLDFVESFFCSESKEEREQMFIRMEQFSTDKNWRLRFSLLEKMESVINILLQNPKKAQLLWRVLDLCLKFRDDLVFAVRTKVLDNFLLVASMNPSKELNEKLTEVVIGWVTNRNYIFRVSGLQALPRLQTFYKKTNLDSLVVQVYDSLINEEVPNVRINMLKTLISLRESSTFQVWQSLSTRLTSKWVEDTDRDVKGLLEQVHQLTNAL